MIIWTDIETTCLEVNDQDAYPLEVSVVITDDDLNELAMFSRVLRFDSEYGLSSLSDFIREMHSANGLLYECQEDSAVRFTDDLDAMLVDFYSQHCGGDQHPLGGSTISFDRAWLKVFFPRFHACLHYRNIDVSGVKELNKRWAPNLHELYETTKSDVKAHRGLDDIRATLAEATLYRDELWGYTPK